MSSTIDEIKKQYEIGQAILVQLFNLNDDDLKHKLQSICGRRLEGLNDYLLTYISDVTRTSKNNIPDEITVYFYSGIVITPSGITFKPEHGKPTTQLAVFNKHFKL